MRAHPFQCGLAVAIGLLVGACENGPTKSETTDPDAPDAPASASNAAGARTFHFQSRGPQAQLFFFTEEPDGALLGDVEVSRSQTKSDQQTFLFYNLQRCDFTTGECVLLEQGSGLIPNGDLVVGKRRVSLHTNTSVAANPAFDRFVGSGGAITLEWTRTSAFVSDFHQHSRTRIEGVVIFHSQFAGTSSSAIAQGTVLGVAVSAGNSNGTVGTVRSGTLIIEKGP